MKIYAIKDTMAGVFSVPFAAENDNVAKRTFANEANNVNSKICVYAKDMDLYAIGEWNVNTGDLVPEVKWLAHATDYKEV